MFQFELQNFSVPTFLTLMDVGPEPSICMWNGHLCHRNFQIQTFSSVATRSCLWTTKKCWGIAEQGTVLVWWNRCAHVVVGERCFYIPSVSVSKLVANNLNIYFSKADLIVNPTEHNYWATTYLLQIFCFVLGSLINSLWHLNVLRNSVIQKRKNIVDCE